jgi:hypothetical protein
MWIKIVTKKKEHTRHAAADLQPLSKTDSQGKPLSRREKRELSRPRPTMNPP